MARDTGNIFDSFIMTVRKIMWSYNNTLGEGNTLHDVAKITEVSPLTLVSNELKALPEIWDILHGVLNVYTFDHVRAANVMGLNLQDGRVLKILDSLNPDRDIDTLMTSVAMTSYSQTVLNMVVEPTSDHERIRNINRHIGLQGIQYGQGTEKALAAIEPAGTITLNAVGNLYDVPDHMDDGYEHPEPDEHGTSAGVSKVDAFDKGEAFVGKTYQLDFRVGERGNQVSIPMVAKLDTAYVPGSVIRNLVLMNEKDIRIGARFKDALKLRINPITDFVFSQDILLEQRKAMIEDPTGMTGEVIRSKNKKKVLGILSGNVSLNTISSILVMSEMEENEIRRKIGGDLTNERTRKKVFDNSSVSMIVVVDRQTQIVSTYVRNKTNYSQLHFSRYKNAGMYNNSNAMNELFKTLSSNRVPSF